MHTFVLVSFWLGVLGMVGNVLNMITSDNSTTGINQFKRSSTLVIMGIPMTLWAGFLVFMQ